MFNTGNETDDSLFDHCMNKAYEKVSGGDRLTDFDVSYEEDWWGFHVIDSVEDVFASDDFGWSFFLYEKELVEEIMANFTLSSYSDYREAMHNAARECVASEHWEDEPAIPEEYNTDEYDYIKELDYDHATEIENIYQQNIEWLEGWITDHFEGLLMEMWQKYNNLHSAFYPPEEFKTSYVRQESFDISDALSEQLGQAGVHLEPTFHLYGDDGENIIYKPEMSWGDADKLDLILKIASDTELKNRLESAAEMGIVPEIVVAHLEHKIALEDLLAGY